MYVIYIHKYNMIYIYIYILYIYIVKMFLGNTKNDVAPTMLKELVMMHF